MGIKLPGWIFPCFHSIILNLPASGKYPNMNATQLPPENWGPRRYFYRYFHHPRCSDVPAFRLCRGAGGNGGHACDHPYWHAVTIPTAITIAEIATNQKVEGGGEYYIISPFLYSGHWFLHRHCPLFSIPSASLFYIIAFAEAPFNSF